MRKKHILFLTFIFMSVLIFKEFLFQKVDRTFLSLEKCPSCYGLWCDDFFKEKITLTSYSQFKLLNALLNVKNVFYGLFENRKVVLKKLGHNYELVQFDTTLCQSVGFDSSCDVGKAVSSLVRKHRYNLSEIVQNNSKLFELSEITKCQRNLILPYLFDRFKEVHPGSDSWEHFVTLLSVNPEPIIIETFRNVVPLPVHFGSCGRISVEEYAGPSLSHFYSASWMKRADIALQLLRVATSLTNNEIRIYLTDPSADNFAVDSEGTLRIIDLENLVLVDSRDLSLDQAVHFNAGLGCHGCFSYDYEEICNHVLSDHNYFAVCKGLLSSKPFSSTLPLGLLHSIPEEVLRKVPNLPALIEECAFPKAHSNRIQPASMLLSALSDIVLS